MSITVVHCKRKLFDIYIGRPSPINKWGYGNPFEIDRDGDRDEVIDKYEKWLRTGENFGACGATEERRQWILSHLADLRGKTLGCFCYPLNCHGDVLAKLVSELTSTGESPPALRSD